MMYCTFCKKQIEDDALFCPYCGKSTPQGDALADLAAAARTGDQDAIGALYEKTYSKVYYTVKSMIKDEDAVFDIVQDTYIKAFAHLDSFQGDTKFLPWVRQIAANTARDWLKKKRPMLFAELSSGDGQDTPVEELFQDERSDNLPDQIIDQKETKRLIREIIEELPEDQCAVIGMFYYEEMSVKEIAAAMGVSESAVKSRLMYGRNKIEKKVLELEKQGTKLYSLSPLPFLLLLFRSQKAYACEAPDGRILQAILASRPTGSAAAAGAAQGADKTGAAAGAGTAGTSGAGTAAAAGGLGALKIGLIALAAVAVVGLGAFGAIQIASHSSEPQQSPTENLVGQNEPEATKEPSAPAETEAPVETEAPKESSAPVTAEEEAARKAEEEAAAKREAEANEYYETGRAYLYGLDGKEMNLESAHTNFEKAEELGKVEANFYLGVLCGWYNYPKQDYEMARTYYEKCGDNPYAQLALGYLYFEGQGVEENKERAKELFQSAIDQGCVEGYLGTGYALMDEEKYEAALEDHTKALEGTEQLFIASAMSDIGYMYVLGMGVEQDYAAAMEWSKKAADLGDKDAMNNIGYLYHMGLGVVMDHAAAIEWFKKSADLGNVSAMGNIGYAYECGGMGVEPDHAAAIEWYKKAVDLGNASVMYNIGDMYYRADRPKT